MQPRLGCRAATAHTPLDTENVPNMGWKREEQQPHEHLFLHPNWCSDTIQHGQNPVFGENPTSDKCLSQTPLLGKTLASLLRLLGRVCVSADGFEGVL